MERNPARLLFDPAEFELRPSVPARLKALTVRARRRSADAEGAEERAMMKRLREFGQQLATRFELRYRAIEAERAGIVAHYGICYADGRIRIRLRHAKTGRMLKESSLVDTLCHELAHLRHMDHSPRFQRLYLRILDAARRLGYYRPGPGELGRPRQLALFAFEACGTGRVRTRDRASV